MSVATLPVNVWRGGLCPGHGAYPRTGCVDCPPAGHPLQVAEAERAARYRASGLRFGQVPAVERKVAA